MLVFNLSRKWDGKETHFYKYERVRILKKGKFYYTPFPHSKVKGEWTPWVKRRRKRWCSKLPWNQMLFYWLALSVFKIDEGKLLPRFLRILRWILCPIDSFMLRITMKQNGYDPTNDCFTFSGKQVSRQAMEALLVGAENGTIFQVISNDQGVVTLGTLQEESIECRLQEVEKELVELARALYHKTPLNPLGD